MSAHVLLNSIYHMTLSRIFALKRRDFGFRKCDVFMDVNA